MKAIAFKNEEGKYISFNGGFTDKVEEAQVIPESQKALHMKALKYLLPDSKIKLVEVEVDVRQMKERGWKYNE